MVVVSVLVDTFGALVIVPSLTSVALCLLSYSSYSSLRLTASTVG